MYKNMTRIYIHSGIGRTGGSYLARLFDNPPYILFLPFEYWEFGNCDIDQFDFTVKNFDIEQYIKQRNLPERLNHTHKAKVQYQSCPYVFNGDRFLTNFRQFFENSERNISLQSILDIELLSYFAALDLNLDFSKLQYFSYHYGSISPEGYGNFFKIFPESYIIQTMRDPLEVASSYKKRYHHAHTSSRFLAHTLSKMWEYVACEAILNSNRYLRRYLVINHADLVYQTESTMNHIGNALQLDIAKELLTPTILGQHWMGNSVLSKVGPGEKPKCQNIDNTLCAEERKIIIENTQDVSELFEKIYDGKILFEEPLPEKVLKEITEKKDGLLIALFRSARKDYKKTSSLNQTLKYIKNLISSWV